MARPAADKGHSAGKTRQITVNEEDFKNSRTVLITYLASLSSAVQNTLEAYVNHSELVLGGSIPLDHTELRNVVDTAMTATAGAFPGGFAAQGQSSHLNDDGEGKKRKRKKRETFKHPDMPKRAQTAFFQFLDAMRPVFTARSPDKKPGEISEELVAAWHSLSEQERLPYKNKYLEERAEYSRLLKAWEAEHPELVKAGKSSAAAASKSDPAPSTGLQQSVAAEDSSDESSDSEAEEAPLPPPTKQKGKPGRPPKSAVGSSPAKTAAAATGKKSATPGSSAAAAASPDKPQRKRKAKGAPADEASETPGKEKAKRKRKSQNAAE